MNEVIQTTTPNGKFNVYSTYVKGPWNVQQETFKSHNLDFISPAQKGLMSESLTGYSRTNMGIVFIENRIILLRDGFSDETSISNLLAAHRAGNEATMEGSRLYDILQTAQSNNNALVIPRGMKTIPTNKLGKDYIMKFMFDDATINATAEEYGERIRRKFGIKEIVLDFESGTCVYGISYDKVRIRGTADGSSDAFRVYGRGKPLTGDGGAYGVRFERIRDEDYFLK